MAFTVTEFTDVSILDGEEFDTLFSSSLPYLDGGTFDWVMAGSPETPEEKREALRTMCKNLVEQTNVNSKCTIGRKDGHPIHITVGAINTNTSDYVSWIYATYGEDANGSKAWLYDEDYIQACKDCFTQWDVIGYRVNFVHNGSLMNYHSSKPWAARFYDVITEDPYTTDNGVTLATMQFTYK